MIPAAQILYWRKLVPPGETFHTARLARGARDPVPLHGHDFAEVFWVDAGRATHKINGSALPLQTGSLVFIRPRDCHAIEPAPGELLQITNIAFARETADFLRERYFSASATAFWSQGKNPISLEVEPVRLALFNRWTDTLAHAPRERLHIERFLLNLLAESGPTEKHALPEHAPEWLLRAFREIQNPEHFSKGVEAFFRLAARSREHVARSAMQFLKMTPTACVNAARMKYAASQLEMSNRDITEIAFDCGFQNLSHFYELFRKQFHATPRAYRLASSAVAPRAGDILKPG